MKPVMKGKLMTKESAESQEIDETNATQMKKKKFLEHYDEHIHIKKACKHAGIHRSTYYRWIKEDEEFRVSCIEVIGGVKDNVGVTLHYLAFVKKDPKVVMFLARTLCRDEGYGEVKEVNIISNERDAFTEKLNSNAQDSIMTGIFKNV